MNDAEGIGTYRRFMEAAADLVVAYGGSFSGEHGDGQARAELLPKMFGGTIIQAFGELKAIFDPENRMNPGKIVAPNKLDEQLRLGAHWSPHATGPLHFDYPQDNGSFAAAANRCVGVGKCRQHQHPNGAVMCPSYQATGEEEHSTRGRARLVFEMLAGHDDSPITDGWRSTEVRDALDLCLACKGCKTDCPANVDMATYKAEFLAHHYQGRLRPRSHYALGWLPTLAAGVSRLGLPGVVNALAGAPLLPRLATAAAGLAPREIPLFAGQSLQQWFLRRGGSPAGPRGSVLLWPDTFTNYFHPHIGQAAVEVLEDAGWQVTMPAESLCCGLTWISTGQLATAKKVLRRTVDMLTPHVQAGRFIVGLEPSCTSVFRSDAADLLGGDDRVARIAEKTVTLAELLTGHTPGWRPPRLDGIHAIAQVHCHQHAVLGWAADQQLLDDAGALAQPLASGCCGLAGNFGFEPGHLDVSTACAESVLLPAVRSAAPHTVVLADGFSCRTQIHELDSGGREAIHLAELLHRAAIGSLAPSSDLAAGDRPTLPRPATRAAAFGATAVTAAALLAAAAAALRVMLKSKHHRST